MFFSLYVDDILLVRNLCVSEETKKWLSSIFQMKYLGGEVWYIGLKS